MPMGEWKCKICGSGELGHMCGGAPPLSNNLDPLAASCEIESLRNKLSAALLQNQELQKEIERCREIAERDGKDYSDLLQSHHTLCAKIAQRDEDLKEKDRLNGVYRKALVDICSVVTVHDLAPDLARRVKDIAQKAYIDGEGQQIEKRNHESVRETAERLGMKTPDPKKCSCGAIGYTDHSPGCELS